MLRFHKEVTGANAMLKIILEVVFISKFSRTLQFSVRTLTFDITFGFFGKFELRIPIGKSFDQVD